MRIVFRVLDSVLPHEITHTIFATHFGRPLPRWADEGACTTVEHVSEREKQYALLIQFLTTNRGIAFNRMFAMREYPKDILPLYAQGYTLARYLIAQGGKKKFVQYVGDGMRTNDWPAATKKYYQFQDLSELQVTWLNWIKKGSPLDLEQHPTLLARNSTMRRSPNETFVATTNPSQNAISDYDGMAPFGRQTRPVTPNVATRPNTFNATADYQAPINQMAHTTQNQPNVAKGNNSSGQSGWYARQRDITKHGITQHGIAQQNNTQLNDTQQLGSRGQIATVTSSAGQPPMSLAPSFNNSNAQSNSQTVASSPKAINAPQRFNHANASINQAHPMQPLQEYARAQLAQSRARQNQSTQHAQSTQHTQATRQYANGVILAQPRRVDDAAVVNSAQWGKTTQAPTARTAVRPMAPQRPQQMIMEPQRGGTYTGGGYVPNGLIRR